MHRKDPETAISRRATNAEGSARAANADLSGARRHRYPVDGTSAIDPVGARLARSRVREDPAARIALDEAIAAFLKEFEAFDGRLDARTALAARLASPKPHRAGNVTPIGVAPMQQRGRVPGAMGRAERQRVEHAPPPAPKDATLPEPLPGQQQAGAGGVVWAGLAGLATIASLVVTGAALWLTVANEAQLGRLSTTAVGDPDSAGTPPRTDTDFEIPQAFLAEVARMRERVAALEARSRHRDQRGDPQPAAGLEERLTKLGEEIRQLTNRSAPVSPEPRMPPLAIEAPVVARMEPAAIQPPLPQGDAPARRRDAMRTNAPAPVQSARRSGTKDARSSAPQTTEPRTPAPKIAQGARLPSPMPALHDIEWPPLLIDPTQAEDEQIRKTAAAAAGTGMVAAMATKERPAPYRAEFTQKYIAAKAGALDGEYQQANIVADDPGAGYKFRGRFASRDREIDPFADPERPDWEDPYRVRMHDVRLEGAAGGMGYGVRDYAAGDKFEALPGDKQKLHRGRGGTEVWTSIPAGPFTIQPRFRQTYDNVQLDPKRPRYVNSETGVTVGQVVYDWPTVGYTVSYFAGDRTSAFEPGSGGNLDAGLSSYEGSIYYSSERFDASVYSQRQTVSDNQAGGAADSVIDYHYLYLGFRPTYETGISAMAGLSDENYTGYGARTLARDFNLDAYYAPKDSRVSYSAYAGYGDYQNVDWYQDYAYSYAGADVKWLVAKRGREATTLSLGLLYDQYVDRIDQDSRQSDLTAWLRLRYEFDFGGPGGKR